TAASNAVALNANRTADTSFTVTNTSGQPQRGRVSVASDDPAVPGWVTVQGEAERPFGVGESQQFIVRITAPPGAAPGQHTFRLDAIGVENPDENFALGPNVTFEVTAAPAERKTPWWIFAAVAAAVVLLVGGVLAFLTVARGDGQVSVPQVEGRTRGEGVGAPRGAGPAVLRS